MEKNTPEDHLGFSYSAGEEKLFVHYDGRCVMILKGSKAEAALSRLDRADDSQAQLILAKLTGNFKRGNERPAPNKETF